MKNRLTLKSLFLLFAFTGTTIFAQDNSKTFTEKLKHLEISAADSLGGFDEIQFKAEALSRGFLGKEYSVFMYSMKRRYINQKYNIKPAPGFYTLAKSAGTQTLLTAPCVNEDFEASAASGYTSLPSGGPVSNPLSGWSVSQSQNGAWDPTYTYYYNTCSVSAMPSSMFTITPSETWVRSTPIADPNFPGGIGNSPLGGSKVLQLNDNIAWSGEISRVSQTFPVTSSNALFQYAYAACFNGTGHLCCDQPFLEIKVKNCANVTLACPNVSVIASGPSCVSGTPGFSTNASGYLYKNWTVQSIDLTSYIGSCVTIEVSVGDCSGWAHFGYCYFDALCSPLTITVNNTQFPAGTAATTVAACGVTSGTMSAPPGLAPYLWNGPAGSGVTNNSNQTITTGVSGNYTLTMNPVGSCAPVTKTVTLVFTPSPTPGLTVNNGCNTFTLTNTGSPAPTVQSYSFIGTGAPTGFSTTASSTIVPFPVPGTYTIQQVMTNTAGCTSSLQTVVSSGTPPSPAFTIPTATQCLVGNSFNFNATLATGTHTYNFNPSSGAPSQGTTANYGPVSFTSPGTYTVTHTVNSGGCIATTSSVVVVNPQPSLTVVPFNAYCGVSNGSIVINNTSPAGQTVVSFSLNGTAIASQTATGLGAGTYNVGLTNNFGCVTSTTIPITNTPPITALSTTFIDPTCGNSNGSIGLGVVTGGSPTYSYSINGGAFTTSPALTGLAPGTYTIVVKDIYGCTFTKTVTLTNQPGPTAMSFTTAPTACVGNTGQVGITGVTGGTAPYTFSVNGTSSGSVTSSLAAGTYTLLVKDNNGCTFTTTALVNMVTGPTAASISSVNATCGMANGGATVTSVTGGASPYQYSFNGGAFSTTSSQSGLTAGPKSVIIKDANGCTFTVNFNIGNTGSPVSSIASFSNISCFGGSNGSFSVSTSGGTPGYSYTLTPGNITNAFGSFTNLSAQGYTVTVKDAAGCVTTVTVGLSQPAALTLGLTSNSTTCNGGNNGTITATAGGGTSPYQYNLNGGANQTSNVFTTNISAGAYNITVTDNKGCTLSQTVSVGQPLPLTVTLSSSPAICSAPNGTASVLVSGGTPIYTYTWLPSGGNNATAANVTAGSYTVTVKDIYNCSITGVVSVTATPGGTAAITNVSNVTCFGAANGSLTAGMTGAFTSPLTYSWSNGAITQTNPNLAPGSYTVQITDFNGCKSSTVGTITQPATITVATATAPAACFNTATGSATASVLSGGTPGFTYLWSPGSQTSNIATGLLAGNYSVQVTDNFGCVKISTITITQPSSVTIVTSTTQATCNQANGAATASASGGTAPYTYTWSTGSVGANLNNVAAGTYSVQVKDNNGCLYALAATIPNASGPAIGITSQTNVSCFGGNNGVATTSVTGGTPGAGFPVYSWSNGQNTGTGTNLSAGVYTVSVTDASGCIASTSVTITQPLALTVTVAGSNPKCFNASNGSANAGVTGGTSPFSYVWSPAPGAGGTTSTPSGMSSGNYVVTVTDNLGCTKQGTVSLVNPPQMLSSVTTTNVSCFNACNGMAAASTTNAVGVISYYYTGGPSPLTSQNVTNLCAGTYTMLATDQNTCSATTVFSISQPSLLTVTIPSSGNVSCSGGSNGFATSSPAGGTSPYSYLWSNGQAVSTATGLAAGNYTIVVTDAQSCTANANITITQPAGLTATVTGTNVTCFNYNNGIGNVAYSGGTGIPTILWQPSLGNTQTAINLAPGIQTVTLIDANNCPLTKTLNITQPSAVVITSLTNTSSNCGQANGSATVVASGGSGGLNYQWSSNPNFTLTSIMNVTAGAYTVVVTDGNGCQASAVTSINDIAGPVILSQSSTSVICNGQSNGTAAITATGNVLPLTYQWSYLGQTTSSVTNLPGGLHSVTVKDAANCITSATFQILQPTQVVTAIGSFTNPSCNGYLDGGATVLVNGGNPGYSYNWTPSAQSGSVLSNVAMGTYTVVVTDVNNCPSTSTVSLTQPNPLLITTNTVINVSCNGGSNGQINTTISGGTPVYNITWTPLQPANPLATNLPAGSYTLSVTDNKGCPTNSVYTITQPSALSVISTATTPATCGNANGTAIVVISGGTSPYSYNWNTSNAQLTNTATALPPGQWIMSTTDNHGCILSTSVTIFAPALPTVSAVSSSVQCFGMGNGSATLTASGVGPFSYNWNPSGLTTPIINGLGPAVYNATVTDFHGCTTFTSVTINQPNALVLNVSPTQTVCFGSIANIYGQAAGGTQPYSYTLTELSSGASSFSTGVPGGLVANNTLTTTTQYTIGLIDNNNCSAAPKTILVNVTPRLLATGMATTACDQYQVNLTANITSPGNGGPYTYNWSNGGVNYNNNVIANFGTTPNTYTLTVDDGCTIPGATAVYTVNVNPAPQFSFTPSSAKGCAPLSVFFQATSTSTAYNASTDTYFWDFGLGGETASFGNPQIITYPVAGTYSFHILATNSFGCYKDTNTIKVIEVYPVPHAEFIANPQTVTILEPTIYFTNLSQGANSYVWDFGDYASLFNSSTAFNPNHEYGMAGEFDVYMVAINSYGCKDTAIHRVIVEPDFALYIPNAFTPDENGKNDMFQPKGVGINEDKYKMEIFDRWGELIFTSNTFRTGWDGKVKGSGQVAQDGVYIYKIFVVTLKGEKKYYVGHVTLLKQ